MRHREYEQLQEMVEGKNEANRGMERKKKLCLGSTERNNEYTKHKTEKFDILIATSKKKACRRMWNKFLQNLHSSASVLCN